jgi:cytochrome c biogenesis protein CcmG, thiol:disulfide interchange protein DsbE
MKYKFALVRLPGPSAFFLGCMVAFGSPHTAAQAQHLQHGGQNTVPHIGAAAIPFELKTLDGIPLSLTGFRDKPLVLNFFASWCDPCREEMPVINELASQAGKDGYNVLGIAVEDARAAVTEYAKESQLIFPIALDLNSTVKRSYRIFGPPATFFIDAQGIIRDVVLGPITPQRARQALKRAGVAP